MKKINKISMLATAIIFSIATLYVSYNNSECKKCCGRTAQNQTMPAACAGYLACKDARRNFCAEAERAADRRISFYQDPSVSEELDREYEVLKKRCKEQNPGYRFQEEDQMAQQEMNDISI